MHIKIRKVLIVLFLMLLSLSNVNIVSAENQIQNDKILKGRVLKVISQSKEEVDTDDKKNIIQIQKLKVVIEDKEYNGKTLTIENRVEAKTMSSYLLKEGEQILVSLELDENGKVTNAYMYEVMRHKYLLYLAVFFALVLIIIGGMKGFKSLITLIFTIFGVLFLIPKLILKGYNPILVTLLIAIGITILTLNIVSGINKKTFAAIFGTIGGLIASGIIAFIVGDLCKLTGVGTEEAEMLKYIPQNVNFDFKGLLYAGILMGALGAIMDVSMSISSSMYEISEVNKRISTGELMKAGMNVGRDIMGTMSNTLILAYAGASLPTIMLLLAYKIPLIQFINEDLMVIEILRALAGSLGLLLSIPMTVIFSGIIKNK
ncbi:YibE/F family protein [Haloimpatiens sp. FM7330]|uniref:YibE/F family protein n=1 Tax=Haloimpatiens sp. FM7330 TaxID=3298610 RepID=UPI0036318465